MSQPKGVEFYLNDGVASFTDKGDYQIINLSSGKSIEADLIILSIGVKPETRLAREAGLKIGKKGGIKINDYSYSTIRKYFMENLPENVYLYNEYHALIVHHGYNTCKAKPHCVDCPIKIIGRKLSCRYWVKNSKN